MSIAYINIGSNLGEREENCRKAIKLLKENGIAVKKHSSMYETEPWGVKDQPKFINMAIEVETDKKPEELLRVLKEIEKEIGRTETVKWGPRAVDLDIIFYDNLILKTDNLEIPHPLLQERDFVLKPLSEIAPDKKHPVKGKTVKEILENFP
ncbi:MAG: 2-amino-4-hydroxy-6-hydroxymethyldihydropteridine diphosphokinase [Thermodesulfovibrionales bacterium]|nr:2-amino-4-hydroxy-6-hydroxymethyldihydropteridine diphosphokinase [Thermodesulfovibrionales bacterium]